MTKATTLILEAETIPTLIIRDTIHLTIIEIDRKTDACSMIVGDAYDAMINHRWSTGSAIAYSNITQKRLGFQEIQLVT